MSLSPLFRNGLVHLVLILAYFLPGGWLWNRVDGWLSGVPVSVWVTAVILPALIAANLAVYVASCWADDRRWVSHLQVDQRSERSQSEDRPHSGGFKAIGDDESSARTEDRPA